MFLFFDFSGFVGVHLGAWVLFACSTAYYGVVPVGCRLSQRLQVSSSLCFACAKLDPKLFGAPRP